MKDIRDQKISWHSISSEETIKILETDTSLGLGVKEAKEREVLYGPNKFEKGRPLGFLSKVLDQFKSPLIFVLLLAGSITFLLERTVDTAVIFTAIVINVSIGLIQEGRASRAFKRLDESQEKYAKVIRNGKRQTVLAKDLTLGDIVVLEAGDYVPADIRLIETNSLRLDESPLTGESVSVSKNERVLSDDASLADRRNMAWMGTVATEGFGTGVVVSVGNLTQIGAIAETLSESEDGETPLQKSIAQVAKFILLTVFSSVVVIFIFGIIRGGSIEEMALVSIAVAVGAIPEGLPAAVTVVLAIGMERILMRRGLVRNLLAAETLGSTTIILTDKTGTLTEANMSLASVSGASGIFETGFGSLPANEDTEKILKMAILASDAFIEDSKDGLLVKGRPLEKSLLESGLKYGLDAREILSEFHRMDYIPFQSHFRFETSLNKWFNGKNVAVMSGSPETLLEKADFILMDGKEVSFSNEMKDKIINIQESRSRQGERFIGVAYRIVDWEKLPRDDDRAVLAGNALKETIFAGLLSFSDPVREDVFDAMKKVQKAGAKVYMLTGDHPETALYIARRAGIDGADTSKALLGSELDSMTDEEILNSLKDCKVFSRTAPAQKLRIVNILKKEGEIVAMTGDGINDAPALKNASIGVAVEGGTEVAKEASDLILLGNSFSIIVSAIEEGRRIVDNLKKIISHLLSTSFGGVFVIITSVFFGLPLPLLPAQILWINIVQGGLLNFAFAFEPAERDIMERNPRKTRNRTVLTPEVKKFIVSSGIASGLVVVFLYLFALLVLALPVDEVRALVFGALAFITIIFTFSLKDMRRPIWKINMLSNTYLLLSVFVSILLLMATFMFGPLSKVLSMGSFGLKGIIMLIIISPIYLLIVEGAKYFIIYKNGK